MSIPNGFDRARRNPGLGLWIAFMMPCISPGKILSMNQYFWQRLIGFYGMPGKKAGVVA
jgi:hypothetical protein